MVLFNYINCIFLPVSCFLYEAYDGVGDMKIMNIYIYIVISKSTREHGGHDHKEMKMFACSISSGKSSSALANYSQGRIRKCIVLPEGQINEKRNH